MKWMELTQNGRILLYLGESTPAGTQPRFHYLVGSSPSDNSIMLLVAALTAHGCDLRDHMVAPGTSDSTCTGQKFRPTSTKPSGTLPFPGRVITKQAT
ncbi:hypothetical protein EVAR_2572_1 [Eumeta japonica]|uniref:Uncharacterized protein n=1 Tax=Eumeta variegata TaxID=151549 RepID=A0A4C1SPW1_EUMVA|nr:hypothetical protein EVAR_2572_1 [Eumeta japonica]